LFDVPKVIAKLKELLIIHVSDRKIHPPPHAADKQDNESLPFRVM